MIKATIQVNSNLKQLADGAKEKGRYRKILTEVASELSSSVKSKTPVKSKAVSSGRKNGAGRVQQRAGNLKESIGVFDSKSQNYVRVWVGARVQNGFDGWYAQMVHNGHRIYRNTNTLKRNPLKRWRKKTLPEKTQGQVKADPFITKTFDSKKSGLEASLKNKIGINLETLIKQNSNA